MGVAETLSVTGIYKIQPCNSKSISTKLEIPKSSLNWKPRSNFRQLRCCCSSLSSSSRFSSKPLPKGFDTGLFIMEFILKVVFNKPPRQLLSVMVALHDEHGQLKIKFDDLIRKEKYEINLRNKANIVLDEVVPLLLKNSDRWISSLFIVSSDLECSDKLVRGEEIITKNLTLQPNEEGQKLGADTDSNTVRCTQVFLDVSIIGGIDDKFKEIHTREDLKSLLNHLMSIQGVTFASAWCVRLLVLKKALEDSFHNVT